MSLTPCPACGNPVSTAAASCPKCGHPLREQDVASQPSPAPIKKKKIGCFPLFLGAVFIVIVIAIGNSSTHKGGSSSSSTSADQAAKDLACLKELKCLGEKLSITAGVYCKDPIEKLAIHDVKWKDSWTKPVMRRVKWKDKDGGYVTFVGDAVQFQNGFGAWTTMIYECDFDPVKEKVLDVRAFEGRLPE